MPFLIGFALAYLIAPCVHLFETKVFYRIHKLTIRRTFSIIVTYIIVIGAITWLLVYFIPEIASTLSTFIVQMPRHMANLEAAINIFFNNIDFINGEDVNALLDGLFQPLLNQTQNVPKMLQTILDGTVVAASTILNLIMGIFIAFYMLIDKEGFGAFIRKIIYVFFNKEKSDHFFRNVLRIHHLFRSFIVGKTIDSSIIGIMCIIGLHLMNVSYATIIGVIVGLTNMIPYFGPFFGAVPAVLMTLLISPSKAIWVALFILALQQFDGVILGPKILGNSTGMSPIWIILAIIVGGAIMGPLGMFLGVPVFASIKLFFTEYINRKYHEKYYYEETELIGSTDLSEETDQ